MSYFIAMPTDSDVAIKVLTASGGTIVYLIDPYTSDFFSRGNYVYVMCNNRIQNQYLMNWGSHSLAESAVTSFYNVKKIFLGRNAPPDLNYYWTSAQTIDYCSKYISTTIVNKTYSELNIMYNLCGLTAGQFYRITDYQTVHNIIGTSPLVVHTGTTEPLVVFATSTNTLHHQAYSTLHSQDIIHYDITGGNTSDISFFNNGTAITGLKGVIYYRKDTVKNISTYYDFRNVVSRRWAINPATWSAGTYNQYDVVQYSGNVYVSKTNGNTDTPGYYTNWQKIWNMSSPYISTTLLYFYLGYNLELPVNNSDFIDVSTFNDVTTIYNFEIGYVNLSESPTGSILGNIFMSGSDCIIGQNSTNNTVQDNVNCIRTGQYFNSNVINMGFNNNITSDIFESNVIGQSVYGNEFGQSVNGNIIGDNATSNNISDEFSGNFIMGNFFNNTINYGCSSNMIGLGFGYNTVEKNFGSNIIGDFVLNNLFGRNFQNNTINSESGSNCTNNKIEENFMNNTTEVSFQHNEIKANTCNGIDFSKSYFVYQPFDKEIRTMYSSGLGTTVKLWYYDADSNLPVFANITD